ncbi:hypothetical protein AAAX55_13065 [Alistipes indistinctus]
MRKKPPRLNIRRDSTPCAWMELGCAPPDNPRFQRADILMLRIEIVVGQVLQVPAVATVPVTGMFQDDAASRCSIDNHTALMDGILL